MLSPKTITRLALFTVTMLALISFHPKAQAQTNILNNPGLKAVGASHLAGARGIKNSTQAPNLKIAKAHTLCARAGFQNPIQTSA